MLFGIVRIQIRLPKRNFKYCTHRFRKLIYLHLFTELFHEDFNCQTKYRSVFLLTNRDLHETVLSINTDTLMFELSVLSSPLSTPPRVIPEHICEL